MIRDARSKSGLSVRSLARKSGITHGHLSQIERGRVDASIPTRRAVFNALWLHMDPEGYAE